MVRATSPSQPNLWIPHLGVQFVDGVAEVSDETAAALEAYAVHGVEVPVVAAKSGPPRQGRPRKSE